MRDEIVAYLNQYLKIEDFRDYAPNGLQVEGTQKVRRVMLGVSASQALVDEAVAWHADMLLVHHGWFWKGESPVITGMKRRRLAALLGADISLVAYHLPLDAHPVVGNNAKLAARLALKPLYQCGESNLVWICEPVDGVFRLEDFVSRVETGLNRKPLLLGEKKEHLRRIALCTGAAQDWVQLAAEHGADLYLSGEVSERTTHEAAENGIAYLAAGHHATERYGIQALGEHLKETFPTLEIQWKEIDNPV